MYIVRKQRESLNMTNFAEIRKERDLKEAAEKVYFTGTQFFSAAPMAAAKATLLELKKSNAANKMNDFGKKLKFCGASRDRTDDPLVANQVLSQLSYSPKSFRGLNSSGPAWTRTTDLILIRDAL